MTIILYTFVTRLIRESDLNHGHDDISHNKKKKIKLKTYNIYTKIRVYYDRGIIRRTKNIYLCVLFYFHYF